MLTPFGKICRKIRIDHGELLKDMARKLGVTPSYLSAVEVGKRNVPEDWPVMLQKVYGLKKKALEELIEARELSQLQIKMDLSDLGGDEKKMALAFARGFRELGAEDRERIRSILSKKGGA